MKKLFSIIIYLVIISSMAFAGAKTNIPDILLTDVDNPNWVDVRRFTDIEQGLTALANKTATLRITKDVILDNSYGAGIYSGVTVHIMPGFTCTITNPATYGFNVVVEDQGILAIDSNITIGGNLTIKGDPTTSIVKVTGNEILTVSGLYNINSIGNVAGISNLRLTVPIKDGDVRYITYHTTLGDDGQGIFYWAAASVLADNNGTIILPTGHVGAGRWVRLLTAFVTPQMFGALADGSTDDTQAFYSALTYLSTLGGGTLRIPAGTYRINRGVGGPTPVIVGVSTDNILSDDITIVGDGKATKIISYNYLGVTPNNDGNEYYNVFQATNRSNIVIKDISFEGYCGIGSFLGCENVVIENVYDNGLLSNDGKWLRNKSVWAYQSKNIKILNSTFYDVNFATYAAGDVTTQTEDFLVDGCTFEHKQIAGNFTSTYPVGVYLAYSNGATVNACTFKNIYSSTDLGTTGTGLGFGVYEGDGFSRDVVISNNRFLFESKGDKRAAAIYISEISDCTIIGNTILAETGSRLLFGIRMDSKTQNSSYTVSGNIIDVRSITETTFAITLVDGLGGGSTKAPVVVVSNNIISGGERAFQQSGMGYSDVTIECNTFKDQSKYGIRTDMEAAFPLRHPKILNNTITGSGINAIMFANYTLSPIILGNTLLDGNTTDTAGDGGAAIFFTGSSQGSFIGNNVIGNTKYGLGLFKYGIQNSNATSARILKDVSFNNTFMGLAGSNFGRYYSSSPTHGILDLQYNDFIQNIAMGAGSSPGWYVVTKKEVSVIANASSASTTVEVSSSTGMLAGDIVLVMKDTDPYNGDYADTTKWHYDTISSVPDGTHIVLTTGIPAGDGTYIGGTAVLHTARFKAASVISS